MDNELLMKNIYLAEAFMAAGGFIDIKFFEQISDGIDILQSKFFIVTPEDRDWRLEPQTWDPSAWSDWMEAAYMVLGRKNIDLKKDKVSEQESYKVMEEFLRSFAYEYDFQDLIELYHQVKNQSEKNDFYQSKQWKQWVFCVNAISKGMITSRGSLYDLHVQIFTKEQSYSIMQKFFD